MCCCFELLFFNLIVENKYKNIDFFENYFHIVFISDRAENLMISEPEPKNHIHIKIRVYLILEGNKVGNIINDLHESMKNCGRNFIFDDFIIYEYYLIVTTY